MPSMPPCPNCGSRRHAKGACDFPPPQLDSGEAPTAKRTKGGAKAKKPVVPEGLTLSDVLRPVREAVPNATVRIPRKLVNVDLNCPICLNVLEDTTTVVECMHRFCSDCINQCLRHGKKECPSCRTPCANKRQLRRDEDFDAIVKKMFPSVSELRDSEDAKAADFSTSDNIKVLSEDLKERLKHQEALTASGGRSLEEAAAAASQKEEDGGADNSMRGSVGFMGENAQLRPSFFVRLQGNTYGANCQFAEEAPPECTCFYVEGTGGCKADCSNRKMRVQCDPSTCPCGDMCTNVLFAGQVGGAKVKPVVKGAKCGVFNTQKKGWALKALEDIGKGRLIEEVTGEVMGSRELSGRLQTPKRRASANTQASNFVVSLRALETHNAGEGERLGQGKGGGAFLDMTDKGSLSRFLNHSSAPNCELQLWMAYGERRVGLFATREIKKDAELTINYALSHVGGESPIDNQEEGRGKGQRHIPFRETVGNILRAADDVHEETAVLELCAEDSPAKKPRHVPQAASHVPARLQATPVAEHKGSSGPSLLHSLGGAAAHAPPPPPPAPAAAAATAMAATATATNGVSILHSLGGGAAAGLGSGGGLDASSLPWAKEASGSLQAASLPWKTVTTKPPPPPQPYAAETVTMLEDEEDYSQFVDAGGKPWGVERFLAYWGLISEAQGKEIVGTVAATRREFDEVAAGLPFGVPVLIIKRAHDKRYKTMNWCMENPQVIAQKIANAQQEKAGSMMGGRGGWGVSSGVGGQNGGANMGGYNGEGMGGRGCFNGGGYARGDSERGEERGGFGGWAGYGRGEQKADWRAEAEEKRKKEDERKKREDNEKRERRDREERERRERDERERREREEREREREERERRERREREERQRQAKEKKEREEKERLDRQEKERREKEDRERREKERREKEDKERREKERREKEDKERREKERREKEDKERREREDSRRGGKRDRDDAGARGTSKKHKAPASISLDEEQRKVQYLKEQVVKALHEIFKDIKPACGKRGKDEKEVKRTLTRSIAYDRSIFPVDASKNDTLLFEVGARISDVDKAVIRDYVKTELHKQGLLD